MSEYDYSSEINETKKQIELLNQRLKVIETSPRFKPLPDSQLLDQSFLKRAFAVFGHSMVASLIIMAPFYILMFLILFFVSSH